MHSDATGWSAGGQSSPPGWYPDPLEPQRQRWWDGYCWHDPATFPPNSAGYGPSAQPWGALSSQPVIVVDGAALASANQRATASLVLGIVSVVTFWMPLVSLLSSLGGGIVAIVLARQASTRLDAIGLQGSGRGAATAGLVTGIVGTSLTSIGVIWNVLSFLLVWY